MSSASKKREKISEMEFSGIKLIDIDMLGLSQIYLNSDKIKSVEEWFNPHHMEFFQPLPVYDFGNNVYTLTDGHTRAYVAYKSGGDYEAGRIHLYAPENAFRRSQIHGRHSQHRHKRRQLF